MDVAKLFLVGLFGSILGIAAGAVLFGPGAQPAAAGSSGLELETLRAIESELASIREQLARDGGRSELAPPASERVALERPAAERDDSSLVTALSALERRLTELGALVSAGQGASATLRGESAAPIDRAAVRAARDALEPNESVTDPAWFGLRPGQVHQRLGTPTNVNNTADRVRWYYFDDVTRGSLIVTFIDGYVAYTMSTTDEG